MKIYVDQNNKNEDIFPGSREALAYAQKMHEKNVEIEILPGIFSNPAFA